MLTGLNLLVVRGAPGTGKTTIGSLFRRFAPKGVVIDIDDVRRMINGERFLYGENEHYQKAVGVVQGMVEYYISEGYAPVVVIDVFSANIHKLFWSKTYSGTCISATLYARDAILIDRMSNRGKGYINLEVAARVNRHMHDTKGLTDIWIDTTDLDPVNSFKLLIKSAKDAYLLKYGIGKLEGK